MEGVETYAYQYPNDPPGVFMVQLVKLHRGSLHGYWASRKTTCGASPQVSVSSTVPPAQLMNRGRGDLVLRSSAALTSGPHPHLCSSCFLFFLNSGRK